ncbi:protein kinase [Achlya hypogyna]|uniref:Protein kinase n=1 Tax=Achlya hypogyna TaxID=1202772 RepID=A0A1V9YLK4_ACHHY|nr:protein kinase [Achlya hypogyna]
MAVCCFAAAQATAVACPYLLSPYNVLTAGTFCPESTVLCQVDNLCHVLWNATGAQYKVQSVAGIGDLRQYTQQKLIIQNSSVHLRFESNFQLPDGLSEFGVQSSAFLNGSALDGVKWPTQLRALYMTKIGLNRLPKGLPRTLTELWVDDNALSTLDTATSIVSEIFSAENNDLVSLINVDFSQAQKVYLSGNPIRLMRNLTVGPSLKLFKCPKCSVDISLTQASLRILNELGPYNVSTDTGVLLGNASSSATSCNQSNGTLATLFTTFTVCVVARAPPHSDASREIPSTHNEAFGWILFGSIFGCLLLTCGICTCFWSRRHNKPQPLSAPNPPPTPPSAMEPSCPTSVTAAGVPYVTMTDTCVLVSELAQWRIEASAIAYSHVLAMGGLGEVWFGYVQSRPVVIKKLRTVHSAAAQASFAREVRLLASLESPHIVALVGVAWASAMDMCLVVEYMDQCDLSDFLAKTNPISFPWAQKAASLHSVAQAIAYLHARGLLHRDVKSKNILLDSIKGTKLADFGTTREATKDNMTVGVGTYRWTAPEVLRGSQYTLAADIYSFGVVVAETDSHQLPYALERDATSGQPLVETAIVARVIEGSLRPVLSAACPPWLQSLARACLQHVPAMRPTANEIVQTLQQRCTNIT